MRNLYLILLALLAFETGNAQVKAEDALSVIDKKYPQEKIHLFLNKEAFVAGETVWFKSYIFSGNVLSLISTNMYLEVYNDQKELVDKQIVPLIGGVGRGSFVIKEKTNEGSYHIRAYTKWMLNFDESFHYFNTISVFNLASSNRLEKKPVQWVPEVFPESGILIADQENKVAVRLRATGSLPVSWTGYVADKKDPGKKLSTVQSFNAQVGSFFFTPKAGNQYQLTVTDNAGNTQTVDMPAPANTGVALRAEQTGDQVYLELVFKGLPDGGLNHKILAHIQNDVVFNAFIRKKDEIVKAAIPVGKLGKGIMHLTIFDQNEKAVAERLVFVDNPSKMVTDIRTDTLSSEARKVNYWTVKVDTLQPYTYAASVSDAGLTAPRSRNIYSDLWLGDFNSNIQNPGWYFSSSDPNRLLALDALMITEKWTRFDWEKLVAGRYPKTGLEPEKYLSFLGTATRFRRIVQNETLNLLLVQKDKSMQLAQVKTDNLGAFQIVNAAFYDTVKVFFQSNVKKGAAKDVDVEFQPGNFFKPGPKLIPHTEYTLVKRRTDDPVPAMVQNALDALKVQNAIDDRYQQLEGVVVEGKRKSLTQKLNEELSSSLFQTDNETLFDFLNEDQATGSYSNIFQFLEGRVPGLNFSMTDGLMKPIMRDGPVSLFIDEIPTDIEMLNNIPISQIAMVKVIRGYFLGSISGGAGSGAIAIYTNKGGLGGKYAPPGMPSAMLVGYRDPGNFKHFDYNNDAYVSAKSDIRDNLFWSFDLYPNQKGLSPIRFFNNDVSKSYRIIITGFTKNAEPVYEERIITVRN